MINSVRNTVLSILNKNNYGYLSPQDFNLFAKQAQLDIFEDYFYQYNYQINKENARQSGTGLADIKKGYEEAINVFSRNDFLSKTLVTDYSMANNFYAPSISTTGFDYYLLNTIYCYTETITSAVCTGVSAYELIDATGDFLNYGVKIGDIVVNDFTKEAAEVTATPTTSTTLSLSADIFDNLGEEYIIYNGTANVNVAEKVSNSKINMLNSSLLTSPSEMFPGYVENGNILTVYPSNLNGFGQVRCQYIRYPKDPKWTYVSLSGGEPSFDQSQPDFQDFELPLDDEPSLVMKILQFAGMSIREVQAVQFGQAQEQQDAQTER